MGYLKVDQMGRIYESSSDQSDGSGFKSYGGTTAWGDVTHGGAYLKSEKAQQKYNAFENKAIAIQDKTDVFQKMRSDALKKQKARIEQAELELQNNESYQKSQLSKALKTNSNSELSHHGNNQLSSNGLSGFHGMTRDQKAIHQHMGTMGVGEKASTYQVSALEKQQNQLNAQAEQQILAEARRQFKVNASEYKASSIDQSVAQGKKRFVASTPIFPQFMIATRKK